MHSAGLYLRQQVSFSLPLLTHANNTRLLTGDPMCGQIEWHTEVGLPTGSAVGAGCRWGKESLPLRVAKHPRAEGLPSLGSVERQRAAV